MLNAENMVGRPSFSMNDKYYVHLLIGDDEIIVENLGMFSDGDSQYMALSRLGEDEKYIVKHVPFVKRTFRLFKLDEAEYKQAVAVFDKGEWEEEDEYPYWNPVINELNPAEYPEIKAADADGNAMTVRVKKILTIDGEKYATLVDTADTSKSIAARVETLYTGECLVEDIEADKTYSVGAILRLSE